MKHYLILFSAIRILLVSIGIDNVMAEDDGALVGGVLKVEDAAKNAEIIFSGKIIEVHPPILHGIGPKYQNVKVHVERRFFGEIASEVEVSFTVENTKVREPEAGDVYIFFAKVLPARQIVPFRMIVATESSVKQTERLVAKIPKRTLQGK